MKNGTACNINNIQTGMPYTSAMYGTHGTHDDGRRAQLGLYSEMEGLGQGDNVL